MDASHASTAYRGFTVIATLLGLLGKSGPEAVQVLANEKKNCLLILDNADDLDFDYPNYLPSGTHGSIIITSRVYDCRIYNTVGAEVIESLNDQDSQELLFKAAQLALRVVVVLH